MCLGGPQEAVSLVQRDDRQRRPRIRRHRRPGVVGAGADLRHADGRDQGQRSWRRHRHDADQSRHRRREAVRRRIRLLRPHARRGRQRHDASLHHPGHDGFHEFGDQWELYKRQRPEIAADEIVRWATPITAFQRTALQDTEAFRGADQERPTGVLFYRSANFDDDVFDDPYTSIFCETPTPMSDSVAAVRITVSAPIWPA